MVARYACALEYVETGGEQEYKRTSCQKFKSTSTNSFHFTHSLNYTSAHHEVHCRPSHGRWVHIPYQATSSTTQLTCPSALAAPIVERQATPSMPVGIPPFPTGPRPTGPMPTPPGGFPTFPTGAPPFPTGGFPGFPSFSGGAPPFPTGSFPSFPGGVPPMPTGGFPGRPSRGPMPRPTRSVPGFCE